MDRAGGRQQLGIDRCVRSQLKYVIIVVARGRDDAGFAGRELRPLTECEHFDTATNAPDGQIWRFSVYRTR